MTPKEKAKELVDKFKYISYYLDDIQNHKEGALIAVDEVISNIEPSVSMDVISSRIKYWEQVKTEIQKL
jgi:hypothetical protein